MNVYLLALLLQSSLLLPPRTAIENPAVVSQVSPKLLKDYEKLWARFISANEDAKLLKDLAKLRQKQKTFDPALMIEGYLALYRGDDVAAGEKFTQALTVNPKNRIAMYYLAELAYAHSEYARATTMFARLQSIDASHPEIETKRQKTFLLATDNLLRSAARAESENRLAEAEDYYRQTLRIAPNEPAFHARLADLLIKRNKKEEAEAERRTVEDLTPHREAKIRPADEVKIDDLEDLGRWGADIEVFHQIRDAEAVTREQFAILIVRYFPQVTELRQAPQIITDIQDSPARSEIQTVVDIELIDRLPNHDFVPSAPVSRGDLAKAFARLSRLLRVPGEPPATISAPDVAVTNAMYGEVQLVLGYGIVAFEESGNFNVSGNVSGAQAVRSAERLLRIFQQGER